MKYFGLAVALVLLGVMAVRAELEIKEFKAVDGPLGPERKSLDVYPFDEVVFRYFVTGAKVDDEGKVDTTLKLRVADATGKVILERDESLKGVLALGGNAFVATSRIDFGANPPAGEFTFAVTITDNLSKETVTMRRKLTSKEPDFRIIVPRFFADPDGKIPASPSGLVGQTLHFRLRAIGFDRSMDKISTEMTVQILDEKGKEILPKPITGVINSEDAAVVKKVTNLNFNGNFALNRAGKFTLRITITDKIAKKSTQYETPITATAP